MRGDSRNTPYMLISRPLITLIRSADASRVFTDINVSEAKSSFPTMEKSFKEIVTLGKCRNSERLTSLKPTLALRLLLICPFITAVIWPLNTNGAAKAKPSKASRLMPVILRVFFTIGARIIG